MGFKKRGLCVFGLFIMVLFIGGASASLGISPPRMDLDFVPGVQQTFSWAISTDNPNNQIDVYPEGELAPYMKLDRSNLTGGGTVKVTLIMPSDLQNKPGEHRTYFVAEEKPKNQNFLGSLIKLRAILVVFIPFPGKLVGLELKAYDGNAEGGVPIELTISNKGTDNVSVSPLIRIFDNGGQEKSSIVFSPVNLELRGKVKLSREVDTKAWNAGIYSVVASANYGNNSAFINTSFKIGSSNVSITDYTKEMYKKGIQKFFVEVESAWNGLLTNVYAEINLSRKNESIFIKTPYSDLEWNKKTKLIGYADMEEIKKSGKYEGDIKIYYSGKMSEKKISVDVGGGIPFIGIIIALAVLAVILIGGTIYLIKRRPKK